MKRIRKSRAARILSWLLSLVMITPLVCSLFAPQAAHAQTPAPAVGGTTAVPQVIVMDFTNTSGVSGNMPARLASSEVGNELTGSGRFDVMASNLVESQIKELGLRAPFDTPSLLKLASGLGASEIVTGNVAFIRVDTKHQPKTVQVGLKVNMLEASSGDLVNGAAVVGTATASPGRTDDDALIQEAVNKAASVAVRQMLSTNLPSGIVLSTYGPPEALKILVNRGSRDGVQSGDEMVVIRDRQQVGRIRVTRAYDSDSEATVLRNNLGINVQDVVRVVFPAPDFPKGNNVTSANGTSRSKGNSMRSLTQILLAVGLLALIISTVGGGKNTSVTGVVAEADTSGNSAAVRIVWRENMFGGSTLESHVWRLNDVPYNVPGGIPIAAVQGTDTYTDLPTPFKFWDGTRKYLVPPTNTTTAGGVATQTTPDKATAPGGFTKGTSYRYQVSGVVRNYGGVSNSTSSDVTDIETQPVTSGQVTPIDKPVLQGPTNGVGQVNLTAVTLKWGSVNGADQFQVLVSTNPNFGQGTAVPVATQFSTSQFSDGVLQQLTLNLADKTQSYVQRLMALDPVFAAYVNGTSTTLPNIYWRVGARNSSDSPGPVHFFTRNAHDGDKTFRFIYSDVSRFTPAQLPPPVP